MIFLTKGKSELKFNLLQLNAAYLNDGLRHTWQIVWPTRVEFDLPRASVLQTGFKPAFALAVAVPAFSSSASPPFYLLDGIRDGLL